MEMKSYRKILSTLYKDHVTNEEVCAKIQQAIGPHEDLLSMVKRRKRETQTAVRSHRKSYWYRWNLSSCDFEYVSCLNNLEIYVFLDDHDDDDNGDDGCYTH